MSQEHQEEPSTPEKQGLEQPAPSAPPKVPEVPRNDPDTRDRPPEIPGGGSEMPGNTG